MRVFDATIPNIIANHPDVIRHLLWVPEDHPETDGFMLLDGEIALTDQYWFLISPNGELCLVFEEKAPFIFEVHTMSLPTFRGDEMRQAAKKLFHEMFTEHGAHMIFGRTPIDNLPARKFNKLIGAEHIRFKEHHLAGMCEEFGNTRKRWLADHWNNAEQEAVC